MERVYRVPIAILFLVILTGGVFAGDEPTPSDRIFAEITNLRMQGRLDDAMAVADSLVAAIEADEDSPDCLRARAMQERKSLHEMLIMSAEDQGKVMRADSLQAEIEDRIVQGRYVGNLDLSEANVELRSGVWGKDHEETGDALALQGAIYMMAYRIPEAVLLLEEAARIAPDTYGFDNPWLGDLLGNTVAIQEVLDLDQDPDRKLERERRALDKKKHCLGPDHHVVGSAHGGLAQTYLKSGNHDLALDHALEFRRIAALNFGKEHASYGFSLLVLGEVLAAGHQEQEAIAVFDEAVRVIETAVGEDNPAVTAPLRAFSRVLIERLRLSEARVNSERALSVSLAQGDEAVAFVIDARFYLTVIAVHQGLLDEAIEHLDAVRDLYVQVGNFGAIQKAYDHHNRGVLFARSGNCSEAAKHFSASLRWSSEAGDPPVSHLNTLTGLYSALGECGDYSAADSIAAVIEIEWDDGLDFFKVWRGRFLIDQGRYEEALAQFAEVSGLTDEGWRSALPGYGISTHMAKCHLALGDTARAHALTVKAVQQYEEMEAQFGWGWERSMVVAPPPYRLHAALSLLLGRQQEAWQTLLGSVSRNLYRLMSIADELSARPDLQARLKELEAAAARDRQRLGPGGNGDNGSEATTVGDEVALQLASEALSAFQDSLLSGGFGMEVERPGTEAVAASIPPDAALIGWLSVELLPSVYSNWGYVLRRDREIEFVRLDNPVDPASALAQVEAATTYRDALYAASARTRIMAYTEDVRKAAAAVHRHWLEPLLPMVGDARSLIVVTSAPLLGIPVEALAAEAGTFLNDRYAISYTPSPAVHVLLAERARRSGHQRWQRALVLGDPALRPEGSPAVAATVGSPDPVGAEDQELLAVTELDLREAAAGNAAALAALPRLPQAQREALMISGMLPGADIKTGPAASEQYIYSLAAADSLRNFDVLHFASHALLDDQTPDGSSIVLSQVGLPDAGAAYLAGDRIYNGLLTANEISRDLVLDADLVTLSACQTGLGRVVADEGYLGLTKAFFRAGARCVLASMWKVADQPTELLMRRFYENVTNDPDMSLAQALQDAKKRLREYEREDGTRPYEHPVYWGGFTLTGLAE